MYHKIQKELIRKGFFDSNGILTKFVGSRVYEVLEDQGEVRVETTFNGDAESKNQLLDSIQSLALRYSLSQANINGTKVAVELTQPGDNALLEATRIDFFTQSLESEITRLETFPENPDSSSAASPSHDSSEIEALLHKTEIPPKNSNYYYHMKNNATEDFKEDEQISVRQKNIDPSNPSHHKYVPLEKNPNHGGISEGVVTGLVDRSFSLLGFLGAIFGATLGAIIISGVHVVGAPVQPIGFLIPFLIIGIYRVLAGHQMSIALGVFLVLGSLLMGSVMISSIELLKQSDLGLRSALWEGLATHYNNEKYFVRSVWIQYGLTVLAASIPTMLLLTGGKRKIKYSK